MASPKNTDRPDAARPTAQLISEPPDAPLYDYSSNGLLLDEDPDEFHAFSNDWWQELAPAGPIEFAIARTIIWLAWRIERVTRLESGLHIWNRVQDEPLDLEAKPVPPLRGPGGRRR